MASIDKIAVFNCGSSTLKFQIGSVDREKGVWATGLASRIFEPLGEVKIKVLSGPAAGGAPFEIKVPLPDHGTALDICFNALIDELGVISNRSEIVGAGHRVVHGGKLFTDSTVISKLVEEQIELVSGLAPLHNPANLVGIRAAKDYFPGIPQVAVFDTAFHHSMPESSYRYPIPEEFTDVRKYGFHGTSHRFVSLVAARLAGVEREAFNGITMHMGNGVSLCAVKEGRSYDTTMGMTPLEGMMGGTRSGSIDPGALFYMLEKIPGMTPEKLDHILNNQSGALALSQLTGHWGDIQVEADNGDRNCIEAINSFTVKMRKYLGGYLAELSDFGPVHAVVFTAGTGENMAGMRERIVRNMERFGLLFDPSANDFYGPKEPKLISMPESPTHIFVIPTNEEEVIMSDVRAILKGDVPNLDYVYPFESEYSRIVP